MYIFQTFLLKLFAKSFIDIYMFQILFSYQVEDLESEKKYMVSLNLSICFESHGPCVVSIPVLKNARLPKAVCDWKSDFIDPSKYTY